jgi:tripartite-type tricarboxylate transporter receptor subunit TctC
MKTGVDMPHIPYRGSGPALNDLMAGQIMVMFETPASTVGHIRAGKIRALAVHALQRCGALPEVPTMAEEGVPDLVTYTWNGLFAPAKTPKPILERVNAAMTKVVAEPAVRKKLMDLGHDPGTMTLAELDAFVRSEMTKWHDMIETAGIPKK